ncbi:unnamed protein product [Pleuronectes platessa]|uniref:Uncharacterized protein n=1 Tax=Pleuronectes platessa TaxID=8262 RepID=A0A9N7Z2J5_PLEPL|nr:unnamed protein product [Pleuronectes platessa]
MERNEKQRHRVRQTEQAGMRFSPCISVPRTERSGLGPLSHDEKNLVSKWTGEANSPAWLREPQLPSAAPQWEQWEQWELELAQQQHPSTLLSQRLEVSRGPLFMRPLKCLTGSSSAGNRAGGARLALARSSKAISVQTGFYNESRIRTRTTSVTEEPTRKGRLCRKDAEGKVTALVRADIIYTAPPLRFSLFVMFTLPLCDGGDTLIGLRLIGDSRTVGVNVKTENTPARLPELRGLRRPPV